MYWQKMIDMKRGQQIQTENTSLTQLTVRHSVVIFENQSITCQLKFTFLHKDKTDRRHATGWWRLLWCLWLEYILENQWNPSPSFFTVFFFLKWTNEAIYWTLWLSDTSLSVCLRISLFLVYNFPLQDLELRFVQSRAEHRDEPSRVCNS